MQKETLSPNLVDRTIAFAKMCLSKAGEFIQNTKEFFRPTATKVFTVGLVLIASTVIGFESLDVVVVKAQGEDQGISVGTPEVVAPETVTIRETNPLTYTHIKITGDVTETVEFNPLYPYIGQLNGEQFLSKINGSTEITTTTGPVYYTVHKGDEIFAINKVFEHVVRIGKNDSLSIQGIVGAFSLSGRIVKIDGDGDPKVEISFIDDLGNMQVSKQTLNAPMTDITIVPDKVYGVKIINGGFFYTTNGQKTQKIGAPYTLYLPVID